MKKRLLSLLIAVILVVSVFSTTALAAAPGGGPGGRDVPSDSRDVPTDGRDVPSDSRDVPSNGRNAGDNGLQLVVDAANAQIMMLVAYAQYTEEDDVDWLLAQIDRIAAAVFAYADLVGGTVVCEYTEYYIDGRYVMIDPLRVVNV